MPRLRVNDVALYYEIHGAGEPLLLLEGIGCSLWMWHKPLPVLARYFQVIAFDHRDIGRSDRAGGPYTLRSLADDAVGLLRALGVYRAHIVGISMGGYVAQEIGLNYPHMVGALVLGSTQPRALGATPEYMATLKDTVSTPEQLVRRRFHLGVGPGYWEENPDEFEWVVQARLASFPESDAAARQFAAAAAFDATARLADLGVPTLVCGGDHDLIVPAENQRLLVDLIPGAELAVYPDAGHYFYWERTPAFARMLSDFCYRTG